MEEDSGGLLPHEAALALPVSLLISQALYGGRVLVGVSNGGRICCHRATIKLSLS